MTSFSSLDEACDAVRAFIRRCVDDPRTGGFNELALGLFAFQFAHNTPYANLCRGEGRTPGTVTDWRDIPAVPTRAFKSLDLTVLPEAKRETVFRSSGTTQTNRSRHYHNRSTLALYHASLWHWFARHLIDDSPNRLLFLLPTLGQAPESMAVIGGGAIGLELGSVWARLGTAVTVVEFLPRIAATFDDDITQALQKLLQRQGLKFHLGSGVESAERTEGGVKLTAAKGDEKLVLEAEKVLVAVGRKPNTEGLGAAEAGVELDERGCIKTGAEWQTSVPGIYAIGDVVAGPMLAHKAEQEAIAAVERMAGKPSSVNYDVIPSVIYTAPELAAAGLTEAEAKANGNEIAVGTFPFQANGRAVAGGHADGLAKVIADKAAGRVLGAQILSANASELIAEAVLLMELGGNAEDLARTIHVHPTMSEGLREAAHAAIGEPLHT